MPLPQIMPFSKQSKAVYQLLGTGRPMSAQEIARRLNILPNAVYRLTRRLVQLGLIETLETYPVQFKALPISDALGSYLLISRNAFLENVSRTKDSSGQTRGGNDVLITFIKTRSELLELTNTEIKKARKSIDHIVSGLELPAETILAYKAALNRGIKLRFLVQNVHELNREMLSNWQKMGLEVRHILLLEARIIIFDTKILYLTSYNPRRKEEAIGVRFAYSPIAWQMSQLFESKWKVAKPIEN